MKNERTFNLIGLAVGVIMIIAGIIFAVKPADSYTTNSVSTAKFGADYYTEQYAATKAVVSNTAVTANNLREIGGKLALYAGCAFIFAGALVSITYAKKVFCVTEAAAPVAAAPVVEAPTPVQNPTEE